jgi:putative glutamine amidotransferase
MAIMAAVATKPVIGITTEVADARIGHWDLEWSLVPTDYVRAVQDAGGRPLLVPPDEAIEDTLEVLDGIIFSGGGDIDPGAYGQEPHPETKGVQPERDGAELPLLTAALERDMPVLAVCRGSQVLNVARGGDLHQHLPEVVGHEDHKHTPGEYADHDVDVVPQTRLGTLLGDRAPVKSHHHQGFGRVGAGLIEAAHAEDGTVEALEDPSKRFALGVLWHPEAGEDRKLFEALVAAAREYRSGRRASRLAVRGRA